MGNYLMVNSDPGERRFMEVDGVMPKRRFTKGQTPTITGADIMSKGDDPEAKWIFKAGERFHKEREGLYHGGRHEDRHEGVV